MIFSHDEPELDDRATGAFGVPPHDVRGLPERDVARRPATAR